MNFKDQLRDDFKKVFLNKDEFADVIMVDGIEADGIFEEESNGYNDTRLLYVRFLESVIVTDASKIIIGEKTYGVISIEPSKHGEKIVFLGDVL
ncbi:MAG: hypothetical protein PHF52_08495 [Sulfurospirillaceae bacterium]|nr:hypothetical protein [Sulfurospirillaceae bacterium]